MRVRHHVIGLVFLVVVFSRGFFFVSARLSFLLK